MNAKVRRTLKKFEIEMSLWNFQRALETITEFKDFPKSAYQLISALMSSHGDCGSERTGYAYIGVPKTMDKIMEIASPWLSSKLKGGKKKPKAIAV